MDPTDVGVILAYAEIKSLCKAYEGYPDETCEPGEKMLATHILGIMERNMREAIEDAGGCPVCTMKNGHKLSCPHGGNERVQGPLDMLQKYAPEPQEVHVHDHHVGDPE